MRAAEAELTAFEVGRDEDGVFLTYAVDFELGKAADEALTKSVPLFFVAEAEIFRDRWYWRDRRVADAQRVFKVVLQPLTSTYRVTTTGGLSQTYPTRERGAVRPSAGRRAGRSPKPASSTTGTITSSSTSGSTSRCCPGRCRSASAASPTGSSSVKRTLRIN